MMSASVSPAMNSMAMNGWPSNSPTSKMVTMLGCWRRPAERASRVKRSTYSSPWTRRQLDRDLAADERIVGQVEDTHSSLTDQAPNEVPSDVSR